MKTTRREFVKTIGGIALGSGLMLGDFNKAAQAKVKDVPSEPIKIGVMPGLSGLLALPCTPSLRTTQIWADEVNAAGGILGRKVELYVEEETTPKECVERFRKLTLQNKVDVVVGLTSTGNSLAVAPIAEELGQLFLSWDGTTQKGVVETMPKTTYTFKSVDNEAEAIASAIFTAKYFPKIKRVAGINNDYSYGRDCWDAYQAVLKHFNPNVEFVEALWPKMGESDFTSHIAALRKAKPDLIMTSFWAGDLPILIKQGAAVGLFEKIKGVMINGQAVHTSLKKDFTPAGMVLGYNSLYFKWTDTWPLLNAFSKIYYDKYKDYPNGNCDHAYFVLQAYKAAVEKCHALLGRWPTKLQIAKILPGIQVPSLSGYRGYRDDNIMVANWFVGMTTHNNPYDFVTVEPVVVFPPAQAVKPSAEIKFYDWIKGWKK